MPNPPLSSPVKSLAQIPAWEEVESDPQFVAADAPTRQATFNNWRDSLLEASINDENAFTRQDFDQFQVFSRRKMAELSGAPNWQQDADRAEAQYAAEEEARQKAFQDAAAKRPSAAAVGVRTALEATMGATMGATTPMVAPLIEGLSSAADSEEASTLRKVLQDEEPFTVFNGRFVASPSLALNKDEYKKALAGTSLDRESKLRAMAELGELRDQVATAVSDNMLKTEGLYGDGFIGIGNDFTKMREYELSRNPELSEADIVEKWRKQNDHWWKNPLKQVFLGARSAGSSFVQQYYGLKALTGLADEQDELYLEAATRQLGELTQASKNIGGATLIAPATQMITEQLPVLLAGPVGRGAGAVVSGAAGRLASRAAFAATGRASQALASAATSRIGLQLPKIKALLAEKQSIGQIAKTLGIAEAELAPTAKMLLREQAIHSAGGQAAVALGAGVQASASAYPEIRNQVLADLTSTLDQTAPDYEAKLAEAQKTAQDTATYQALRRGLVTMAITTIGNKLGGGTGEAALAKSGTLRQAMKDNFAVYLFKTAGKDVLPEAIEEASDSLVNGIFDKMTYDPTRSVKDIAADTVESGAWGGFMGGFFGGIKAAATYSAEKQAALRSKPVTDLLTSRDELAQNGSPQMAAAMGALADQVAEARVAAGLAEKSAAQQAAAAAPSVEAPVAPATPAPVWSSASDASPVQGVWKNGDRDVPVQIVGVMGSDPTTGEVFLASKDAQGRVTGLPAKSVFPAEATPTPTPTPAEPVVAPVIQLEAPTNTGRAKQAEKILTSQGIEADVAAVMAARITNELPADAPVEAFREQVLARFAEVGGVFPGSKKQFVEGTAGYEAQGFSTEEAQDLDARARAANEEQTAKERQANRELASRPYTPAPATKAAPGSSAVTEAPSTTQENASWLPSLREAITPTSRTPRPAAKESEVAQRLSEVMAPSAFIEPPITPGTVRYYKFGESLPGDERITRTRPNNPAVPVSYTDVKVEDIQALFGDTIPQTLPAADYGQNMTPLELAPAPETNLGAEPPVATATAGTAPEPQTPTPTTSDATQQSEIVQGRVEERVQNDERRQTPEAGGSNRPVGGGQVEGLRTQENEVAAPAPVSTTARLQQQVAEMESRLSGLDYDSAEYAALTEELMRVESELRALDAAEAPATADEVRQVLTDAVTPKVTPKPTKPAPPPRKAAKAKKAAAPLDANERLEKLVLAQREQGRPVAKNKLALISTVFDKLKVFNTRAEAEAAFGREIPPGKYGAVIPLKDDVHIVVFVDDLAQEGAPSVVDVLFHEALHFAEEQMLRSDAAARKLYKAALPAVSDPQLVKQMERIYPGFSALPSDEARFAEVVQAVLEQKLTTTVVPLSGEQKRGLAGMLSKFLNFLRDFLGKKPALVTYTNRLAEFIGELNSENLKALPAPKGSKLRPVMFASRNLDSRQADRLARLQRDLVKAQNAATSGSRAERATAESIVKTLVQEIATLTRPEVVSPPKTTSQIAAEFASDGLNVGVQESPADWTYEDDTRPQRLRDIDSRVVPAFVEDTITRGLVQWGWEGGRSIIKINESRLQEKIRKQRLIVASKMQVPQEEVAALNMSVDLTRNRAFVEAVMARVEQEYQALFPSEDSKPTSLRTGGREVSQDSKRPRLVFGDPANMSRADRSRLYDAGLFPVIHREIPVDPAAPVRVMRELSSGERDVLKLRSFWPHLSEEDFNREKNLRDAAEKATSKKEKAQLTKAANQLAADAAARRFSLVISGAGKGSVLLNGALEKSPIYALPEGTKLYRVLGADEQTGKRDNPYAIRSEGTTDQLLPAQHVTTDLAAAKAHAKLIGGKVMEVRSEQVRKVGDNLIVPGGTFEVVQRSGGVFIVQHLDKAPPVLVQGMFTNAPEVTAMQLSKGFAVTVPVEVGDAVHPHIEWDKKTRLVTGAKVAALGSDVFVSFKDGEDAYAKLWTARQPIAQKAAKVIRELEALENDIGMTLRDAKDQLREVSSRVARLERDGQQLNNLADARQEQARLHKIVGRLENVFPTMIDSEWNEVPFPADITDPAEQELFASREAELTRKVEEYYNSVRDKLISANPLLESWIVSDRVKNAVLQHATNVFRLKKGLVNVAPDLVLKSVMRDFYKLYNRAEPLGGETSTLSGDVTLEGATESLLSGAIAAPESVEVEQVPLTNDERSLLGQVLFARVKDGDSAGALRLFTRENASNEDLATARRILDLHFANSSFTVNSQTGEITLTYGPPLSEEEARLVEDLLPKVAQFQFSSVTASKYPNLARQLVHLHDEASRALTEVGYSAADIRKMSLSEMVSVAKNSAITGMLEYLDILRYQILLVSGIDSPSLATGLVGLPPTARQIAEAAWTSLSEANRVRLRRLGEADAFEDIRDNLRNILGPMFDMPADPEAPRFSKEALQRFREEMQRFGVDATNWRDDNRSSMTLSSSSSRKLLNYLRYQNKGKNSPLSAAMAEFIQTVNEEYQIEISTVANGNTSMPVAWRGDKLYVDLNAFPVVEEADTPRIMEQFALQVQQAVLSRMIGDALDLALAPSLRVQTGQFTLEQETGVHPTLQALEDLRVEAQKLFGEAFPAETGNVRDFIMALYRNPSFAQALNETEAAGGKGFKGMLSRVARFIAQLIFDFLNPSAKIKVNFGSGYHYAVAESLRLVSAAKSPATGPRLAAMLSRLFSVPASSDAPVLADIVNAVAPANAAAASELQEDTSETGDAAPEEIVEQVVDAPAPVNAQSKSSPGTSPNSTVVVKPKMTAARLPADQQKAVDLVTSILDELDSQVPLQATSAPEGSNLTLWVTGDRDAGVIHFDVNNLARTLAEWRESGMSESDAIRRLRAGVEEEIDHLEIHRRFSDSDLIRIGLGIPAPERHRIAQSIAGSGATQEEVARAAGDGPNMTQFEQARALAILADEHLRQVRQRVRSGFTTEDVRLLSKSEPRSLTRVLAYLTAYFRRVASRWSASGDPISLRAALNTASFLAANGQTVDQITGGIPDIADRIIATATASTAYGDIRVGASKRTLDDIASGMFDSAPPAIRDAMKSLADMDMEYDSLTNPELVKRAGELVAKHSITGPMTGDDMMTLAGKVRDDKDTTENIRVAAQGIIIAMAKQASIKATDPEAKTKFRTAEARLTLIRSREASLTAQVLNAERVAQDQIDPHRATSIYGKAFVRGTKATLATLGLDPLLKELESELGDPAKVTGDTVDGVVGDDVRKTSVKAKAKKAGVSTKDTDEAEADEEQLADAQRRRPRDELADAVAETMLSRVADRLKSRVPAEDLGAFEEWFKRVRSEVSRQISARFAKVSPKGEKVTRSVWDQFLANAEDADILRQSFDSSIALIRNKLAAGGDPDFNGPPTQEQVDRLSRTLALLEGAQVEVLSMKQATQLVRQSFRFRDEIKAHVSDQYASITSLTNMLIDVGELEPAQANMVAKYIEVAYQQQREDHIKKLIKRYQDSAVSAEFKAAVEKLSRSEKLVEFARMGAFRSEEFYSAVATALDLPNFDPKIMEQLEADTAAINDMPAGSIQRTDAARALGSKVADLTLKQILSSGSIKSVIQSHPEVLWTYLVEIPTSMWKSGILSGFGTAQVNLAFGSLQSLMDLTNNAVGYALTAPKGTRAKFVARSIYTMFKSALLLDPATRAETITEVKRALFTGATRFQSEQTESLSRLERDLPLVGKITKPFALLGRVMMVIDALVGVPANMARQRMAIAHLATRQGLEADEIRNLLGKAFSPDEAVLRQIERQLDGEAQTFALSKNPELMREARRNQLLEEYRSEVAKTLDTGADIISEGRASANVANLSAQPQGFAGWVMDGIFGTMERRTRGLSSLVVPFARSLSNMLDFSLAMSFPPISFLRAYNVSPSSFLPNSMISETYRRQTIQRGSPEFYKLISQGFMSTFLAGGLVLAFIEMILGLEDEEEPFIAVYGDGPTDYDQRNQLRLRAPFWKPNTMKVGSMYINWKDLPGLNLLLGGMAALSDTLINAQEKGTEKIRTSQFAVNTIIQTMRAMFAKQPLQGLEDTSKLLFGKADPGTRLDTVLMKVFSGWVGGVTNPRILRDTEDIFRGLLSETGETSLTETPRNWTAALQSVIPGSNLLFDRPAILNARGKEVTSFWFAPLTKRLLPDMESPHMDEVITPLVSAGLYLSPPESSMAFKTWKDPQNRSAGIDQDGATLSSFEPEAAREALIIYGDRITAMLQQGNLIGQLVQLAGQGKVQRETAQQALKRVSQAARNYAQAELQKRIFAGELLPHWQQ